jgi:diguanylate cyclase (GGDEF)-like protein
VEGTYNAVLVLTSLLVAILAAYTALDMVDRVNKSPRRVAGLWLIGGGFAMGGGIWSMHFIGMLAYTLPIPLGYDPLITLLSLSAAIAASTFALWLASQSTLPTWRLLPGALLMGLGIAGMHYLGMEAMRMRPAITYDPFWFVTSIVVAMAASWTALRVFFLLRTRQTWGMRLAASTLLGFAVVGMHYTGMAATRIPGDAMCGALRGDSQLAPNDMAVVVTVLTVAVLALVLLLSLMDRRMESRMLRMRNAMLSLSLEEANAELSQATLRDPLTRLANRHLLKSRVTTALLDAQHTQARLALMVIDIDGFQYINDAYGHQTGDQLLVAVAERLRELTRATDTLARTGGDEFVLLTRLAESEDPGSLAARIVSSLAHDLELDGRSMTLTASVGVALSPTHTRSEQELMSYAIAAMQQAKQSGRNHWLVFSPWMSESSNEQIRLLGELRQAIGSEQISLHYQPKLRTRDNTIAGAEALLRWDHPELGNIPGERVVRLAERGGLTLPLGNWMLEQACRQLQQWHALGHTQWTVSVNLSPLQFHDAHLLGHVRDCLERFRIPARQLLLEITESTVMRDTRTSIALLNSLSALGVGISIDDFGTGYSSLLYLKQLPATELKIGNSFTQDLRPGSNEVTIVSAVIALGHGLDMDVVAEGIGNREQRLQLERMGCDFLQGHLVGLAVSPARFEQLHAPRRMAVKDTPATDLSDTLAPPPPAIG